MYGNFGWNTGFGPLPRGHEILTERALGMARPGAPGSVTFTLAGQPVVTELTGQEATDIVEGNRAIDVADLAVTERIWQTARERPYLAPLAPLLAVGAAQVATGQLVAHVAHSVREADQKLHALRRSPGQDWRVALREIVAELQSQHRGILAEPNARARLRRVGAALHLIQDSYCPAHTERGPGNCIRYVRNYGGGSLSTPGGGSGSEHRFPFDDRDSVAAHPGPATAATAASKEYLQVVFKMIYGRVRANLVAVTEANEEFQQFVLKHFRAC